MFLELPMQNEEPRISVLSIQNTEGHQRKGYKLTTFIFLVTIHLDVSIIGQTQLVDMNPDEDAENP
jgi:hypothetical protein